jgi:predicted Zn-dependent peptidase
VSDRTLAERPPRASCTRITRAPVVSSYVFFRSGSRNEHYGQTGIAHLFEHMMFNGGKKSARACSTT